MNNKGKLSRIYNLLFAHFGPQYWWPAKTKFEVLVGAVLTQNAAWSNVEKAIANLKRENVLSFKKLLKIKEKKLAKLIRPAGYFNVKTKRLKNLLYFIQKSFSGNISSMRKMPLQQLREKLLNVNGVGKETADSIILYALDKPVFVIDTYTKRVLSRHHLSLPEDSYDEVQELCISSLKKDAELFNEYHALFVRVAKEYCRKNKPFCNICPLRGL